MEDVKLEFYVLNEDFGGGTVRSFNIFANQRVYNETLSAVKKYLRSPNKFKYERKHEILCGFDAFVRELSTIVFCEEWSRIEYEIGVVPWGPRGGNTEPKRFDCYDQFKPNARMIANYVIKQYKNYIKEQKAGREVDADE